MRVHITMQVAFTKHDTSRTRDRPLYLIAAINGSLVHAKTTQNDSSQC